MIRINWKFIASLEGTHTEGYVPEPDGSQSGVTIGTGFDLGAHDAGDLSQICRLGRNRLPGDMEARLTPYLGLKGQAAVDCLAANPLRLTKTEVRALDIAVKKQKTLLIRGVFNQHKADNCPAYEDLPAAAQTIIASVGFQYGHNLHIACPRFFSKAIDQDWPGVIRELQNFGDSYPTRRGKEARYLADHLPDPHINGNKE